MVAPQTTAGDERPLGSKVSATVGGLLIGLAWLAAARFLIVDVGAPSAGWQVTLGIAAGAHVAGWAFLWLGFTEADFGLRSSRAVLGSAGALTLVGVAFALAGLGQYGQWREYRDASICGAGERALPAGPGACISEQAAVIRSIRIDTSTPSQHNVPDRGQELEIELAGGARRTVSVRQPPWVTYERCERGLLSDTPAGRGFAICKVPVQASVYRGRVTRLTLPGGARTDTDLQPGGYRSVAWLGVLCLLGALWPLLALGLRLRHAERLGGAS